MEHSTQKRACLKRPGLRVMLGILGVRGRQGSGRLHEREQPLKTSRDPMVPVSQPQGRTPGVPFRPASNSTQRSQTVAEAICQERSVTTEAVRAMR